MQGRERRRCAADLQKVEIWKKEMNFSFLNFRFPWPVKSAFVTSPGSMSVFRISASCRADLSRRNPMKTEVGHRRVSLSVFQCFKFHVSLAREVFGLLLHRAAFQVSVFQRFSLSACQRLFYEVRSPPSIHRPRLSPAREVFGWLLHRAAFQFAMTRSFTFAAGLPR